jgi:hypothetical protein
LDLPVDSSNTTVKFSIIRQKATTGRLRDVVFSFEADPSCIGGAKTFRLSFDWRIYIKKGDVVKEKKLLVEQERIPRVDQFKLRYLWEPCDRVDMVINGSVTLYERRPKTTRPVSTIYLEEAHQRVKNICLTTCSIGEPIRMVELTTSQDDVHDFNFSGVHFPSQLLKELSPVMKSILESSMLENHQNSISVDQKFSLKTLQLFHSLVFKPMEESKKLLEDQDIDSITSLFAFLHMYEMSDWKTAISEVISSKIITQQSTNTNPFDQVMRKFAEVYQPDMIKML